MGAWGTDSFSNDDALDWLQDFADAPTTEMLRDTLEHITKCEADEYLEAPDCAEAVVAAEIVAALSGKPAEHLPDELKAWLQSDHGLTAAGLTAVAQAAVKRVTAESELKDIWQDSDFNAKWLADMCDLERRLA